MMKTINHQRLGDNWERTSLQRHQSDSAQVHETFDAVVEKLISRYPFQIQVMTEDTKDVVVLHRYRVDGELTIAAQYFDTVMRDWLLGATERPRREGRVPDEIREIIMNEVLDPAQPMPGNACELLFAAMGARHVTDNRWSADARTVARWIKLPVRDE